MSFIWKDVTYFVLVYVVFISVVLCDEINAKDSKNRSKRTVGLFLQSLASFLNVQDVEYTTPITFTTSAPGYRRKSPPPKVQKWPPLDLEITPWVLQAVPPTQVATPLPPVYPATTTVYPPTEEPGLHAQVIIIPLSETENHLNSKVEVKKGYESYLRPENVNPKPIKYTSPNYQSAPSKFQMPTTNYQHQPHNSQPEVYYWQRLFPNQRSAKQNHLQQQQQQLYQPLPPRLEQHEQQVNVASKNYQTNSSDSDIQNRSPKQIQLLQKDAEALLRIGYIYGRTIKDELSNLGGNDFNREKQDDKFRSFIDLEPKFRYNPNSTTKKIDLSQLYLSERNKRLKKVNSAIKFPTNRNKSLLNDNSDKTNVEIVKSVEPMHYDIDYEEQPKDEVIKDSKNDDEIIDNNPNDSPTFEMVKSFELPNSELLSGNKNFEFHLDPDENPDQEKDIKTEIPNNSEIRNKNNYPFKNKKITFIPPSERESYEPKKRINGERKGRLNKYFSPENVYRGDFDSDQYNENEYFRDISTQNPNINIQNQAIYYGNAEFSKINSPEKFQTLNYEKNRPNPYRNKFYQDVYDNNEPIIKSSKYFNFPDNNSAQDPEYEIQKERINFEPPSDTAYTKEYQKINYKSSRQPPNRGRVKYNYAAFNKNQPYNDLISKDKSLKFIPPLHSLEYNSNDNINNKYTTEFNPYSYTDIDDPSKFNREYHSQYFDTLNPVRHYSGEEYSTQISSDLGVKSNEDVRSNYDFPLQNPEAQLHIFIPDEQSLQSPEKQEKSDLPQYQNDSPEFYQEHVQQLPNENKLKSYSADNKAAGEGMPRLPENLHEQLVENNGVRRNLVSPPSFDQQTDTTEHKLKCLPQPFVKLKYACNNTEPFKKIN